MTDPAKDTPICVNHRGVRVVVGSTTKGIRVIVQTEGAEAPIVVWVDERCAFTDDDYL